MANLQKAGHSVGRSPRCALAIYFDVWIIKPVLTRLFCFLSCLCLPAMVSAEPRLLTHRYGQTEVSGTPQRVVSLSFIGHDFLLGLGVMPIAVRYWYGDHPFGVWPWAQHALGDAEPQVITGGIDVEAVALLQPDLIVGQWSGMTETEYRLLSRIAPTLPPPEGQSDYSASWQQMTRQIGRAMGLEAQAEAQIAQIEARFAAIETAHPDWQGKTAAAVWPDQIGAYTTVDLRGQFLEQLGFVNAPDVEALAGPRTYNIRLSQEDLTPIDTDLLMWLTVSDPAAALARIRLRPSMRAFLQGREVVADPELTAALSHSSPLSLSYALDRLEPMIAAAVDGDPTTEVPQ
ncbi:MAG: ABC transporter substrate-binding protein [Pseudomonadota bacterium]